MATIQWFALGCLTCLIHVSLGLGFFDGILDETDSCEDVCKNTYPLHTYEKALHLSYCQRGCRLFTIIDFVNEDDNLNTTRDSCVYSCREAHRELEDASACVTGCDCQVNVANTRRQQFRQMAGFSRIKQQMVEVDQQMNPLYPFLYVHNWYSNMIDKLSQHMSVSWSFYMQSDDGRLVVVKSEPTFFNDNEYNAISDDDDDYKTSNYIETNLASVDNSATPNLKHSAIDSDMPEINFVREEVPSDWLGCIAKKTGLPRMLLSFTIFISAIVMIWLCFTTAATAPEHRVPAQKLSIYGDLDYLRGLEDNKSLLASIHPQEKVAASPLPIKIQVQRI